MMSFHMSLTEWMATAPEERERLVDEHTHVYIDSTPARRASRRNGTIAIAKLVPYDPEKHGDCPA